MPGLMRQDELRKSNKEEISIDQITFIKSGTLNMCVVRCWELHLIGENSLSSQYKF